MRERGFAAIEEKEELDNGLHVENKKKEEKEEKKKGKYIHEWEWTF